LRKLANNELDRKTITDFKAAKKTPLVIVLDNVRSALNVGSVFRTADAFLIEKIILCGITAQPPNKDIRKSALGATDSVEWTYYEKTTDAIEDLKRQGYTVLAIEQADESVYLDAYSINPTHSYAVIFGHEVKGVSTEAFEMTDSCLEIPQYGTKHSLNIAVSVGVVVWDLFVKLTKK